MILVHGTPYCLIRANLFCGQMCIIVSLDWIFKQYFLFQYCELCIEEKQL